MPFHVPSLPPVPPPVPAIGATPSAPLNHGLGWGGAIGTNLLTLDKYGQDVGAVAFGTNLTFQALKFLPFNQHAAWPVMLLVIAFGLFMLLTQGDWTASLRGAMPAAVQSAINYVTIKGVGGINLFPAAPDP